MIEELEKESSEITYENMKCEDIDEVRQLWETTEGIHLHTNGEESNKSIEMYLLRNPEISKVARNNRNEIIGSVLAGHDGRRGLIHHLVVKSNYQRKGIGKRLLSEAKESLKEEGIKKVFLFVLNKNNNGIEFYKHLNWTKEEIISVFSSVID
jgi:N-acetylglutamate synthase